MNANCIEQSDVGASNRKGNTPTVTIGAAVFEDVKNFLKMVDFESFTDECEDCQRTGKDPCTSCWQERARVLLREVEG